MKTSLSFGLGIAIACALLTLVMFFAGMHSDPAKLGTAQWAGGLGAMVIYIVGLCFGLKARRAETPVEKPFGYGAAFGNAMLISLFAIIAGVLFQSLYEAVINPNFVEIGAQAQRLKMEAKGMSDDQIDKAMSFMKPFMSPVVRAIFGFIFLAILDTVISLIVANFFTRKNPDEVVSL